MKFSYNWLKELVKFKESPERLAELLTMYAFECETAEKTGNDWALEVKITPNRLSDAAGHFGLAREIAAIKNIKFKFPTIREKGNTTNEISIQIQDKSFCPRYLGQVISVKTAPSPQWMREKLVTCGFRPVNLIVDITNYVMLEVGFPLHAFDLQKIKGQTLNVRASKEGERLITLDNTEHELPAGSIIIENGERIIDLAGTMGGKNSEVDEKTEEIFLQAAVFNPVRIYKTTRKLGFFTAASKLYAAGMDPNQAQIALERAIELLEKMGGKRRGRIDIYPKTTKPQKILFRPSYANLLIGHNIRPDFFASVFSRLGFSVKRQKHNLTVEIPTQRRDIVIEEDLIEEVARIFGYENIPGRMPEGALVPAERNEEVWWQEIIKDELSGAGFAEYEPYEFIGERELKSFFLGADSAIELENPISAETKYLLPRAMIKFAAATAENLRDFDSVRLFGIAKSFKKQNNLQVDEHKDLIVTLSKKGSSGEEEFFQLKGTLDQLIEGLGISDFQYSDTSNDKIFHPYRRANIIVNGEKTGSIGELHPEILDNLKSNTKIIAAEINVEMLWKKARTELEFRPMGKYPAIIRDIAVVVPQNAKAEDVLNVIENTGGPILIDTDLFDYFQDEALTGSEEKSLAFHLTFQSPERTLKDAEANSLIEKITQALEEKGWEVKK